MPTISANVTRDRAAAPFLKWAGGKGHVLPQLAPFFPSVFRNYFEPFLGGGAVFFFLSSQRASLRSTLIDANPDLVNCYLVVRDRLEELLPILRDHQERHSREHFYLVRAQHELSPVQAAARFIYLNKTCYNGLYRVNRRGHFNAPMGSYVNPHVCDDVALRAARAVLRTADLLSVDFSLVQGSAQPDDFVYFDPPFVPLSKTASFTSYWVDGAGKAGFGLAEQERLALTFRELDARGCKLVLSNSDCPLVHQLYAGFIIDRVLVPRMINSKADRRGAVSELVVRNFRSA